MPDPDDDTANSPLDTQIIAKEITALLRSVNPSSDAQITTGKIERAVVEFFRTMDKVNEHDRKIAEHESFIVDFAKAWTQSINGITSFLQRRSGKK